MDAFEGVILVLTAGIYPALWYVDRRTQRMVKKVDCLIDVHLRRHPEDAEEIGRACLED